MTARFRTRPRLQQKSHASFPPGKEACGLFDEGMETKLRLANSDWILVMPDTQRFIERFRSEAGIQEVAAILAIDEMHRLG